MEKSQCSGKIQLTLDEAREVTRLLGKYLEIVDSGQPVDLDVIINQSSSDRVRQFVKHFVNDTKNLLELKQLIREKANADQNGWRELTNFQENE